VSISTTLISIDILYLRSKERERERERETERERDRKRETFFTSKRSEMYLMKSLKLMIFLKIYSNGRCKTRTEPF
jgi:hypothetical protein